MRFVIQRVNEQERNYSGLKRIGIFALGSVLFLGAEMRMCI